MGRVIYPPVTEIYLCDTNGVRIEALDYVTEFEYVRAVNDIAPFSIRLPKKFDRNKIVLDGIIEIWRGFGPGNLKLDYCGFIRRWSFEDEAGFEFTYLTGYSVMDLLRRRVVANYAGSAQAKMTNEADDMIKAIAKDQLGADTTAARDLTSVGGGFTIQADLADGQSITKGFSYRNVLELAQDISIASSQAGTDVYFDMVPIISSTGTGSLGFQLQTFTDQRGNDRTWDSSQPIFIGTEWGNFENGLLEYDYSDEVNYCYVLGPGEGAARETTEVSDTTRINASIWNRREGTKDARNLETGDTGSRTADGYTYLQENKATLRLRGNIVETPAFRYGIDWMFGDKVTVSYAGLQRDAMINKVRISCDSNGDETITARLEIDE